MWSEVALWIHSSLLYAVISGAGRSCVPATQVTLIFDIAPVEYQYIQRLSQPIATDSVR
jgi:hypothetical protein